MKGNCKNLNLICLLINIFANFFITLQFALYIMYVLLGLYISDLFIIKELFDYYYFIEI